MDNGSAISSDNVLCFTRIYCSKSNLDHQWQNPKWQKKQYDINRVTSNRSALWSDKIDKYDYLTNKEILRQHQNRIIQEGKFTSSPLPKVLKNQTETIEKHGKTKSSIKIFRISWKRIIINKTFILKRMPSSEIKK